MPRFIRRRRRLPLRKMEEKILHISWEREGRRGVGFVLCTGAQRCKSSSTTYVYRGHSRNKFYVAFSPPFFCGRDPNAIITHLFSCWQKKTSLDAAGGEKETTKKKELSLTKRKEK